MATVDWYDSDPPKNSPFKRKVVRANRAGIGAATLSTANLASIYATMILGPHHANARAEEIKDNRKPRRPSQIEVRPGSKKVDAYVNLYDPDGNAGAISQEIDLMWRVMRLL